MNRKDTTKINGFEAGVFDKTHQGSGTVIWKQSPEVQKPFGETFNGHVQVGEWLSRTDEVLVFLQA